MKKELCFAAALLLLSGTSASYAGTPDIFSAPPAAVTAQASPAASGSAVTSGSAFPSGSAVISGSAVTSGGSVTANSTADPKPTVKLSLKDAVTIMQTTGTRAETAELNRKSDMSIATGYSETIQSISETLKTLELLDQYNSPLSVSARWDAQQAGATEDNRKILRLRRDFAKGQVEPNYKAEMNQIEYDTIKLYYGVLLASENLKTEQDNLKTQQDILKNTKAQYQVGMLAKKDVISAESAVTSAKSGVRTAETKLEYARMSFNYLLGYAATQEVVFTDSLSVVSALAINVDDSVKKAVAARNEIKGANFAVEVHKILLSNLAGYPKNSSVYMKQQIALLSAEKTARDAPVQIEIDIRNKAAELDDKKAALEAARAVQAYAEEGYRLIRISYEAGMTTLAELQAAQVNVYKAGLAVSAAISDYDLAVCAFRYAEDVGIQRLPL